MMDDKEFELRKLENDRYEESGKQRTRLDVVNLAITSFGNLVVSEEELCDRIKLFNIFIIDGVI